MAPNSTLPAMLLRTYTSILGRRFQLPPSALRILGLTPRIQAQDAVKTHFDTITSRIQNLAFPQRRAQLQPIPVRCSTYPQRRHYSTQPDNKIYSFDDILSLTQKPTPNRLLIDVREPHEFQDSTIPGSINIPIASQPDALLLSEEDFEDRFGFAKPDVSKEVVFFCRAGVRSRAAAGIAREAGYSSVSEYPGSWLDWEKRGGPGEKGA